MVDSGIHGGIMDVSLGRLMRYEQNQLRFINRDFMDNNFLIRGFFENTKEFRLFSWDESFYNRYFSNLDAKAKGFSASSISSERIRVLDEVDFVKLSSFGLNFWENIFLSLIVVLGETFGLYEFSFTKFLGDSFEFNLIYNMEN